MMTPFTRRRAIAIVAAASLVGSTRRSDDIVWRGVAMGSEASITFSGLPRAHVEAVIPAVTTEIERLEGALSLFREDSEICRLNREGALANPSADFLRALQLALRVAEVTGSFDPTVQTLWEAHVDWFTSGGDGLPPDEIIGAARSHVDWRGLSVETDAVRLRPGQRITLNGLGQGYVTDRVADLLRANGFDRVLVDLGEFRALGPRDDGSLWKIERKRGAPIAMDHGALATSEGSGCILGAGGLAHHLFDPASGRSANLWRRIIVRHTSAAVADALSTAFYALPAESIRDALPQCGSAEVYATDNAGGETWLAARAG
jgi:thiamine biosynthesis lipoprotein